MVIFYNENGERIGKDYEVGWNFNQKRNKEGTGKIELIHYPKDAKYATLYKGTEEIKTVVLNENSSNEKRVSTSVKTLESLFKNYRLPENWRGWNKQPLSFVLADAIYGFDYIRKSTLADFTDYIEKVNVSLNKIKDGDIHLDYHEVEDGIRYYEQGQITFAFDCGEAISQRYIRWVETTGEKVYTGIQSVSSNTPITDISQVDFSNVPILTINRGVENDSSFSGLPIASDKRYVAVRIILKYVNPDWTNDFATHKVYNENNVLVDRTVRGFTPVIRAFEIITRKKTEFNVISNPADMGELIEGIELSNITIWEAIQKIREKYPFDTVCYFKDGKVYFKFSKSLIKDKKKKAGYMLRAGDKITRHLNNTNIKELKTNIQKVNVLHCYGEGEKQQRLYVRIPETGTYDNMATVEDVFTDTKIKTKKELKKRGLEVLKEKRKDDKPVFEVETVLPIRLFDEVSLIHPETNTIYDVVVEEENISYKENNLTQKFGIGGFLFNPIEALIKKEKYPDMRDYAMQPFGLTAYGKHRSIVLVWQGVEENYIVKWKEKGSSEYNYRNVKGLKTEIEGLKERGLYLFSIASTVNNMVSDYTCEIEAGTIHIYSKEGCIFLSSLDIKGDYKNQTGTYQGLLYKWNGTEWELLNAVMPINPVCYYDFEELSQIQPQNIIFKNSSPIFENKNPTILYGQQVPNNQNIIIETSCTFTGNANPFLSVYNEDWSKILFQTVLEGEKKYCLYIPYGKKFYCGIWMNGSSSYIPKEEDSVTLKEIIISKITDIVLDKSGNENHLYIKGSKDILPKTENNIKGLKKHGGFLQTKKDIFDKEITISMFFKPECIPDAYHHIFEINGITPFVKNNILVDYPYETFRYELQKNKLIHFVVTITKTQVQIFIDTKLIGTSNRDTEYESKTLTLGTWHLSYGFYKGFMAQVLVFDKVLTQQEILWLYHNPQYPVKNYTSADWAVCPQNPDNVLANATPKYLGVVESVPVNSVVTITKGEITGGRIANPGDWVLSGKTVDDWKVGVCYKWNGVQWQETNNPQYSQATLQDALDLCKEMGKSEDIPAVQFANKLVALEAFVESLSAQVVYFQKSVASLVSSNPKVSDQMIFMGHNYRQYDPNEPFSFGIDELSYKGYHNGKDIEIWRELMRTKQIRNIAGASILSLFLTGCVRAGGGYELPAGSVISANKVENLDCGWREAPAVTANGKKALSVGGGDLVYSDDSLKTFRKVISNIEINDYVTAYENKFYTVKRNTNEYYSSTNGTNWTKEGTLGAYQEGDDWYVIFDKEATNLGFTNIRTGKKHYIYTSPNVIVIQPPEDKPKRRLLCANDNIVIAYKGDYDGLSISYDKGILWEDVTPSELSHLNNKLISIIHYNKVFYCWRRTNKEESIGYYTSKDGKNWVHHRADIKHMRYIFKTDKDLVLVYSVNSRKDTIVENITNNINNQIIHDFSIENACYYPQANKIVLAGSKASALFEGSLYVLAAEGILTGSGITNFETADNYLAAQFGNGLQMVAYSNSDCPKPFVGKAYTVGLGNNKLKIGRWF